MAICTADEDAKNTKYNLQNTNYELFSYQLESAHWLSKKKVALLALEMGLGKSAIAIRALDIVRANPVLILCPAVAVENWRRELALFATLKDRNVDVYSYSSIHKVPNIHYDALILDESHLLKSTDAKRTQQVLGAKVGLVRRANRVWALSGTPAPNHAGELWPLLVTFGATKLSYEAFVDDYCTTYKLQGRCFGGFKRQITGTRKEKIPELKKMLAPIMLRKKKEDVALELPPITYEHISVPPNEVDFEIESSFIQYVFPTDRRHEFFAQMEKERDLLLSVIDKTGMGKAGQKIIESVATSVSTLRRFTGMKKVHAVADLIAQELKDKAYEKVVIFAIHRDVIEGLRVRLSKFGAVSLYGGTPPDKRQKHIDSFQKNKATRVFIGNIHSAGTAITLTASHHVVFVEQDWVPGNNAQAAMRCHRIGQTNLVSVRFVSLENDVLDEKIVAALQRKTKELTAIFDE